MAKRVDEPERENQHIAGKLKQAETIIKEQKKYRTSLASLSPKTTKRNHEYGRRS
jgi:hypothetical protein